MSQGNKKQNDFENGEVDFYTEDDNADLEHAHSTEQASAAKSVKSPKEVIADFKAKLKEPKNKIILGIAFAFLLLVLYKLLFGGNEKNIFDAQSSSQKSPNTPQDSSAQPTPRQDVQPPQIEPPKTAVPEIPALPSIPDTVTVDKTDAGIKDSPTALDNFDFSQFKENAKEKTKAKPEPQVPNLDDPIDSFDNTPLLKKKRTINPDQPPPPLIDLSGAGGQAFKGEDDVNKKEVSNFVFVDSGLDVETDQNEPLKPKKIEGLSNVIAQGRIIDAVLETAINSQLAGNVRAIVTRNVYGEIGKNILIPKGTRLYGSYQATTGTNPSQDRLIITWTRLIRPDGVTATINSFAADQFGRSGIQGVVDKKYYETITSSVLISVIPLISAVAARAITGASNQTTSLNSQTGTSMITSDPINTASTSFINSISTSSKDILKEMFDTAVTIRINQGSRLRIVVNQDLKMPDYTSITAY